MIVAVIRGRRDGGSGRDATGGLSHAPNEHLWTVRTRPAYSWGQDGSVPSTP